MGNQVVQLRWAHIDVKDHLFVCSEGLAQVVGLLWLERRLARSVHVLLHLCVIVLIGRHV